MDKRPDSREGGKEFSKKVLARRGGSLKKATNSRGRLRGGRKRRCDQGTRSNLWVGHYEGHHRGGRPDCGLAGDGLFEKKKKKEGNKTAWDGRRKSELGTKLKNSHANGGRQTEKPPRERKPMARVA